MEVGAKVGAVILGVALLAGAGHPGVAVAASGHEGHGSGGGHGTAGGSAGHAGMGHGSGDAGQPAAPQGVLIREVQIQGRIFTYRLYSWDERNAMMKGMEGHKMAGMDDSGRSTHHLMLYVRGADGRPAGGGKVGFVATGPDKAEFKTLTMAMNDGYGADLPLKGKGVHTIRTKAVFGDQTLAEEFSYLVK